MAHGAPDRVAGFALFELAAGVIGLVAVLVMGPPPAGTWGYIIASALLHLAYLGGLLASYQLGEFSQMYPLARGTSPWLVAGFALVFPGPGTPVPELIGVPAPSAGLIRLAFLGGPPHRKDLPACCPAGLTGGTSASAAVH